MKISRTSSSANRASITGLRPVPRANPHVLKGPAPGLTPGLGVFHLSNVAWCRMMERATSTAFGTLPKHRILAKPPSAELGGAQASVLCPHLSEQGTNSPKRLGTCSDRSQLGVPRHPDTQGLPSAAPRGRRPTPEAETRLRPQTAGWRTAAGPHSPASCGGSGLVECARLNQSAK